MIQQQRPSSWDTGIRQEPGTLSTWECPSPSCNLVFWVPNACNRGPDSSLWDATKLKATSRRVYWHLKKNAESYTRKEHGLTGCRLRMKAVEDYWGLSWTCWSLCWPCWELIPPSQGSFGDRNRTQGAASYFFCYVFWVYACHVCLCCSVLRLHMFSYRKTVSPGGLKLE